MYPGPRAVGWHVPVPLFFVAVARLQLPTLKLRLETLCKLLLIGLTGRLLRALFRAYPFLYSRAPMPMARFGIVTFPGSNCDHDAYHAVKHVLGDDAEFVWHQRKDLDDLDVVILPGGFSYGDYLRSGAIARFSPVMEAVTAFANDGGYVLGVCNGFQVLCEAGLLPGTLARNESLRFVCKPTSVRVERTDTPFTSQYAPGSVLSLPVAHGEGRYVADDDTLAALATNNQVVFRYTDSEGRVDPEANPNGSMQNIAGICNETRNVLGLMPHPERHVEMLLGSDDGLPLFESLQAAASNTAFATA